MSEQTSKRIIAGIIVGVFLLIVGMLLANSGRITVVETQMTAVNDALKENKRQAEENRKELGAQMETNRKENDTAHQRILDELKGLKK